MLNSCVDHTTILENMIYHNLNSSVDGIIITENKKHHMLNSCVDHITIFENKTYVTIVMFLATLFWKIRNTIS